MNIDRFAIRQKIITVRDDEVRAETRSEVLRELLTDVETLLDAVERLQQERLNRCINCEHDTPHQSGDEGCCEHPYCVCHSCVRTARFDLPAAPAE